jgi:transcriptional regulator with XRE-family HTH domain
MSSFQITITPSKRAAGRFISRVRRVIQRALAEEANTRGLTQSDLARAIGVNRSVINREIQGTSDITLGRVGELAWALGRRAVIVFESTNSPFQASIESTSRKVAAPPSPGQFTSTAKAA